VEGGHEEKEEEEIYEKLDQQFAILVSLQMHLVLL